jgi:hypothetical protein
VKQYKEKNPYLALIAMMTNDTREKISLKLQTLILKKTPYVSWNTSAQIDYQD